jgi:thiamine biosynthesis lipoprotein
VRVLDRSRSFHALSRGAFDVTVKPVLDLLESRFPEREPSAGELEDAALLVGAEHLNVKRRRIRFARAGMSVTTDGIAKGYIVDRMAEVLAGHGVRRFLIDAGGDIRGSGLKEKGRPWMVGVRGPGDTVFPDAIALQDGSVATSGSYERFYDAKRRFHHIVNPASGGSPVAAWSVSVVAPTALAADALATTVFVLGPDAGMRLLETVPACAGFMVTADGDVRQSCRWSSLTHSQKEYLA